MSRALRAVGGALTLLTVALVAATPAMAGDAPAPGSAGVGASTPEGEWRTRTDGVRQTVTFDADGTVYGDSGCNRFTGSYEVDGDMLTIGPLASTLIMCEENVMDAEQIFLTKLQAAVSFTATDARLRLYTPKDLMVLRAVR